MYWSYFIRTALISGGSYYSFLLITALLFLVMPLADGQGGLYPIRNLGVQLTLLQPGVQIMPTKLLLAHPDLKTQWHLCNMYYVDFLVRYYIAITIKV